MSNVHFDQMTFTRPDLGALEAEYAELHAAYEASTNEMGRVTVLSNWDALNREYLIVYAPSKNRPFLVQIAPPSVELRNAITLGFGGRDRICGKAGEHLQIGAGMGRRYSIMDVKRLDKETALQMKDRLRAREKGTVGPAAESPCAELENVIQPDKQDTAEVHDKPPEGSVQDEQEGSSE